MRSTSDDAVGLDWDEFVRWIKAAKNNLEGAKRDMEEEEHNWACFKAEQAGQLAVKALYRLLGRPAWGHDIYSLYTGISELLGQGSEELLGCARYLARLYIPTRYPDALPGGVPSEYFDRSDSEKAIRCAEKILEWVERVAQSVRRTEKA